MGRLQKSSGEKQNREYYDQQKENGREHRERDLRTVASGGRENDSVRQGSIRLQYKLA
jgi:hypothetical protein